MSSCSGEPGSLFSSTTQQELGSARASGGTWLAEEWPRTYAKTNHGRAKAKGTRGLDRPDPDCGGRKKARGKKKKKKNQPASIMASSGAATHVVSRAAKARVRGDTADPKAALGTRPVG